MKPYTIDEVADGLYVSGITPVREQSTEKFDRVVTVCQDSVEDNVGCAYEQFPLSDGSHASRFGRGEWSYDTFEDAVNAVRDALNAGETVLVHCHAGVSRSPSTAAAALAVKHQISPTAAYDMVEEGRPETQPHPDLVEFVRRYVAEEIAADVAWAFRSASESGP